MKLLYNEEELFCIKIELLNFKVIQPIAKLDMVGSKLVSNGLIFLDDILFNIQLVILLLLFNITELNIRAKTKKFW